MLEVYHEHRNEYRIMTDRHDVEMNEAIRREFSVGTKVKYSHGPNKITAEVVEISPYLWKTCQVTVRNLISGNKKEIEAQRLERA